MGTTYQSLDFINKNLILQDKRVCDLGSQQLYFVSGYRDGEFAKEIYINKYKVKEYLSIDQNGEGGVEIYDLNKLLPEKYTEYFDVVLNEGTLEHVTSLYYGFKNMHDLCKINGTMIHVLPLIGNWPHHGYHYFSTEFFENLADLCNYNLVDMFVDKPSFGGNDSYQVFCALTKTEKSTFPLFSDYYKLAIGTVNVTEL